MKPLRKQPFERLAATIEAEQKQAEGDREAKRRDARQDYMPLSEVDGDDEDVESEIAGIANAGEKRTDDKDKHDRDTDAK